MIKILITNVETSKSSVCSLDLTQENIFHKIWLSWDIKWSLLSLVLIIYCIASEGLQPGILLKLGNNYSDVFPNLTSVFQHCQSTANLLNIFSLVCSESFCFVSNFPMPQSSHCLFVQLSILLSCPAVFPLLLPVPIALPLCLTILSYIF